MGSPALSAEHLTVKYGKATAVDGIDVFASSGSVTAVVGPNGAGKSSLILALYGSIPAVGTVEFSGRDVSNLRALARARAGIAIVPQGRQLFPKLTVRENLSITSDLLKLPKNTVDAAIERFPALGERVDQLAGVLSGGEQQMLVVSRALMSSPDILLLDEMMTGLAPKIVSSLVDNLQELAQSGVAILIADPSIGSLRRVIDRGYVIVRGRVVASESDVEALDSSYQAAMGIIQEEVRSDDGATAVTSGIRGSR